MCVIAATAGSALGVLLTASCVWAYFRRFARRNAIVALREGARVIANQVPTVRLRTVDGDSVTVRTQAFADALFEGLRNP